MNGKMTQEAQKYLHNISQMTHKRKYQVKNI